MTGMAFWFLLSLDYKSNLHNLLFRTWRESDDWRSTKQKAFDTGEKMFCYKCFVFISNLFSRKYITSN